MKDDYDFLKAQKDRILAQEKAVAPEGPYEVIAQMRARIAELEAAIAEKDAAMDAAGPFVTHDEQWLKARKAGHENQSGV